MSPVPFAVRFFRFRATNLVFLFFKMEDEEGRPSSSAARETSEDGHDGKRNDDAGP
ncbi:MAG: hypothetical protein ACPIOQ_00845 [Promethearchaeia archaeon]